MLMLYAILLASAGISIVAEASAIKGHARPHEDLARSIKLAPPAPVEADRKSVQAPILESSKRIYNDESIRRLAAAQPPAEAAPVPEVVKQAPVPEVVKQAPVVEQAAPVVPVVVPVVESAAPVRPIDSVAAAAAPAVELAGRSEELKPKQAEDEAKRVFDAIKKDEVAAAPALVLEPKSSAPIKVPAVAELEAKKVELVAAKEDAPAPAALASASGAAAPVEAVKPAAAAAAVYSYSAQDELQAKKDEATQAEPLHIEVPAPDPGLVLSEPIDSTTKLLIDLDEHVQKFLPAEEQQQPVQPPKEPTLVAGIDYSPAAPVVQAAPVPVAAESAATGKSSVPLVPYSSVEEPIVPALPSLDGVEKASAGPSAAAAASPPAAVPAAASSSPSASSSSASSSSSSSSSSAPVSSSSVSSPSATRQAGQHQNQQQVITQLLDQLDSLQNRIQDTINQLVARRRYVMSALLRPMGTYVRRVRTNLERLQNRVNQLQAAASSVGGGQNRPGGLVDAAAMETIRRRIDDISKRISEIVNGIRFSFTPTSAPLNSNGRK